MSATTRLRLFYLLYYGNVGTYLPYFAAYLRGRGYSGGEIGVVQMMPSLLAPVVALSWASYADHRASPQRALRLASAWAAIAVLFLPFARTPWQVGAVVALMSLGDRAVVPLVDSITLDFCRGNPGASYARVRLWGSVGFIVASLAAGWALTLRGDRPSDPLVPVLVAALVVAYALVSRRAPATRGHDERPAARDLAALATDRRLHLLLAASAIHWAACAPYHLLFGVFVRDRGLSSGVTGAGVGIGVAAEIAALVLFPRLERRVPLRGLFAIAFLGSAVRWALLSRATGAFPVAALQALHFLTFGLFWGCATHALAGLVPARLRATGQAAFTAIVFGGGNALGYALSGLGYDRLGGVGPLFGFAAAAELASLAIVLVPLRARASRADADAPRARVPDPPTEGP
ncbi:MAG TPA: MFS transporter [Anaeromyxobacter sp.]|nr:MFS transporter [Anaeromyxobacter sp.]